MVDMQVWSFHQKETQVRKAELAGDQDQVLNFSFSDETGV